MRSQVDTGGAAAVQRKDQWAWTERNRGEGSEPRGVPGHGWQGEAHQGNRHVEGSTAAVEQACDHVTPKIVFWDL
jgi:hypothetical protein